VGRLGEEDAVNVKKFVLTLGLLVLVIAGGVVIYLDSIAKTGIETGAGYALGVPTSVKSVHLGVASGNFEVRGLRVKNPPGFRAKEFFSLDRLRLELPVSRLLEDTVSIPLLELDGIDVSIEKGKKGANYTAILANLQKLQSSAPAASGGSTEESGPSTNLIIKQLLIKNIVAHLDIASLPGDSGKMDVTVPEISLHDISSKDGGGVAISQVTSIVTRAVLQAIAKKGIGLPAGLLGDLQGGLAGLGRLDLETSGGALAEQGGKLIGTVGERLKAGGKALPGNAAEAGKQLKGKLLDGLFGRKGADTAP